MALEYILREIDLRKAMPSMARPSGTRKRPQPNSDLAPTENNSPAAPALPKKASVLTTASPNDATPQIPFLVSCDKPKTSLDSALSFDSFFCFLSLRFILLIV